jgi:diguanylate cyclase (GGDEF)-like protein/PAS domain S-box-containing protein
VPARADSSSSRQPPRDDPARSPLTKAAAIDLLRSAGTHPILREFPEGVIIVFDEEFRYLCAGGRGLSTVGLTQEMIEGKTIYEVFPPEVSSVLEGLYRGVLQNQEASIDIPFGSRTFQHRVAPLNDPMGAIVAGIGFAFDVTEARQAEQTLRATAESLRQEQRRLAEAEAIGHAGSWEWDVVNNVITWSDGLFALHQLERTSFEGDYLQAASRVHPEDRDLVDRAMETMRRNEPARFRYRIFRAGDGEVRWFDSRGSAVFENGQLIRLIGSVADVTEQVLAEAEVLEANAFQQAVMAASPDHTFISNLETGAFVYGSRGRDLLGRTIEATEALGAAAFATIVHPDDHEKLVSLNAQARHLSDGQVLQVRYRLRHVDGSWHWFRRHVVPFRRGDDGAVVEILGVLRDITEIVEAEEQLTHDALHDNLTGLPNRALLLDRLGAALSRSERESAEIAVLYCDLDGFKSVNDTGGHAAGDAVLAETARRLVQAVRAGDTISRVGGDEFVLLLEPWNRQHLESGAKPARRATEAPVDIRVLTLNVAQRIVDALSRPYDVGGALHEISVSIGITYAAPLLSPGLRADDVMQAADAAMYVAKRQGKNQFAVSVADAVADSVGIPDVVAGRRPSPE